MALSPLSMAHIPTSLSSTRLIPTILAFWLLAALVSPVLPASAQTETDTEVVRLLSLSTDTQWGEYLAGQCVTCHASNASREAAGKQSTENVIPGIYGASAAYLARALLDYRGGLRANSTMQTIASSLSDEEIAAVVRYLSEAKK